MAPQGCRGSSLCCDIFINVNEAEANIVLIKSTVDTNLEGAARCVGGTTDVTLVHLECLRMKNESFKMRSEARM